MKIWISVMLPILAINLTSSVMKKSYECANPNNKLGVCISLFVCPTLLRHFLNSPGETEHETFLQNSYCENGFGAWPFVCCTNQISFLNDTQEIEPEEKYYFESNETLPATQEECTRDTYQAITYIQIDKIYCVGSILNARYILSSGWCVQRAGSVYFLLTSWYQDLGIEKKIFPENYLHDGANPEGWKREIGLIRTKKSIEFNKEIAPICLPSAVPGLQNYQIEDVILFTRRIGWHVTFMRLGTQAEKCEVDDWVPIPEQMVRNDKDGIHHDFCEYGAPLVAKYNGAWVIYGVYNYHQHKKCPVFSRISNYENWIIKNIEP